MSIEGGARAGMVAPDEKVFAYLKGRPKAPSGAHWDAAMRYWEHIFSTIEPNRFRTDHAEHQPRYWHGELHSPALLSAATAIAAKTGLGASTVFLTLFAVALHNVTRINPVLVRPVVGNRFRPGLSDVVCTVAQAGICVLDVAGRPFEDAMRQVRRSVIKAYKYAYFDHAQMLELQARIERERGVALDTRCFLNDRHGVAPAGALYDTTTPPGKFRWVRGQDDPPFERLFVEIDDVPDAVQVTLRLDTRLISLADAEACAVGMERIAVEAATDA